MSIAMYWKSVSHNILDVCWVVLKKWWHNQAVLNTLMPMTKYWWNMSPNILAGVCSRNGDTTRQSCIHWYLWRSTDKICHLTYLLGCIQEMVTQPGSFACTDTNRNVLKKCVIAKWWHNQAVLPALIPIAMYWKKCVTIIIILRASMSYEIHWKTVT